jgi:hypothetical protein
LQDRDNHTASVKDLLDGLRHAGLIPDDREEDIQLEVEQEKVGTAAEEGTRVEISY